MFALCHLLGFRFAPRIRHVGETRLFSVEKSSRYPTLERLIGGAISTKQITAHWDEALRLAASIQHGTVTASLMLRKLGAYPRQNALALALREIGKLERTLFLLEYIQNIELRKRIESGRFSGVKPLSWLAIESGSPDTSAGRCSPTPRRVRGFLSAGGDALHAGSIPSVVSSPFACSLLD